MRPGMDALIGALSVVLAGYDRTLADPGVHRMYWLAYATISIIIVFALVSAIYVSSRGTTADVFTSRSWWTSNLSMILIGGAFLGVVRMRWKAAEYLRRLLELFVVVHCGMLLNDFVGLWLGRPLYQTMVANLVMLATGFGLASLMLARWLAWLMLIYLVELVLCLMIPELYLVFIASGGILNATVGLVAWHRHRRQLGALSGASQPDAGGIRARRGR
jgi:hypothetical protein